MKTFGKTTACRDIHREIEEADRAHELGLDANDHLNACSACQTFYSEQFKLREIVSSLGTVAAPGDFEFRLRARLAGERRRPSQFFTISKFSFGVRSTAFAAVLMLIGSALLFVMLRPAANKTLVAHNSANESKDDASELHKTNPVSASQGNNVQTPALPVAVEGTRSQVSDGDGELNSRMRGSRKGTGRLGSPSTQVALVGNDRVKTQDMGSTQAAVLKTADFVAGAGHSVFPIEASPQSLRVSLNNGRGSSKTISLPGVSFGSQGVLNQNASPLLASARGSW